MDNPCRHHDEIVANQNNTKVCIAELTEKVRGWIYNQENHTQHLLARIEEIHDFMKTHNEDHKDIMEKIVNLPCKERSSWYVAISRQVGVLWIFISALIILIVTEYLKSK